MKKIIVYYYKNYINFNNSDLVIFPIDLLNSQLVLK